MTGTPSTPGTPRTPFHGAARRPRAVPRWWPLPAGILLGALAGGGYGLAATPQYTATSYVIAVPTEQADPMSAVGFAQAYGKVATQIAVLGDAQKAAGVPVATLRDSVRAETSPDAPMVSISASSPRPDDATRMANAVARALTAEATRTKSATHVELLRFTPAVRPGEPSTPSAALTALVGTCAGGLLGGLALLLRPRREEEQRPATATVPAPAPEAAAPVRGGA
jgi:capsular polysaccharide biosynthesis protein